MKLVTVLIDAADTGPSSILPPPKVLYASIEIAPARSSALRPSAPLPVWAASQPSVASEALEAVEML
jgi:hypothetical protein